MSTQAKLQLEDLEESSSVAMTAAELRPILEALIYVADEPITEATLVTLLGKEHQEGIREGLRLLQEHYQSADCGLEIKEVAGGYRMATKAEHHEWVRKYVKHHTPPTKLSLASLETLAVIAYRQPITVPEIQEVRGVNAVSVLKTLLDKKLITTSGRKNVIGRPILYRTTKEFLVHFGLKNLDELPSLEEFEDLARSASDAVAQTSATEEPDGEVHCDADRFGSRACCAFGQNRQSTLEEAAGALMRKPPCHPPRLTMKRMRLKGSWRQNGPPGVRRLDDD